jgi:hypothetical protein
VQQRTLDPARAAAIYKRHVDDPAFFDRLDATQQVRMLQAYADTLTSAGVPEQVAALLDRAEATLDGLVRDTRRDRSSVLWTRAVSAYFAQDYATAFVHIGASNDYNKSWTDERIAEGAIGEIGTADAQMRAVWEAAIGWEYAQTLPE